MIKVSLAAFFFLFSLKINALEAQIAKLHGSVKVNGRTAQVGKKLREKTIVEAIGKKSFVQVNFDNGDIVRIRNGSLIIKKMDDKLSQFKILKGMFFVHADKKNKRNLEVQTRGTAMGIRGTKFFVSENEKETYLCVCEGSVELSNGKANILVNRGEDIHATKTSALSVTAASDMMWSMASDEFKQMGLDIGPKGF